MNKTDKAKIAESYRNFSNYARQLSNIVYNVSQGASATNQATNPGEVVRKFDAAHNHFRSTLTQYGILAEQGKEI